MDKNMIKIDDLLRQHLDGAEEQERAGAWGNMRDLLDKQMPVSKVPAGTNWRRMFAYVAGVVLLAAVSVGGYEMLESFNTDGNIAENSNNTPRNNAVPASGLAGTAINSLPDDRQDETEEAITAPATDVANNTVTATKPVAEHNVTEPVQPAKGTNLNSSTANTVAKKLNTNTQTPTTATSSTEINAASVTKTASTVTVNSKTANTDVVATTTQPATTDKTPGNAPVNNKNQDISKVSKTTTADIRNKTQQNAPDALTTSEPQIAKVNTNNPEPKFKEVPYKKTVRRESIGPDGKPQMDTIFNGEDVMKVRIDDEDKLAANKSDDENSGSNIMPAAAAPSAKSESNVEDANMQKLGDHKVSSKRMKNFNPSRFEEMVKNAKFRMGKVKFYPGIVAGANMSFNGNAGMQAGLAGNLTVGDRWAILTEVKFAYTFNNSKENLQDDYIDNVEPTLVNNQAVYKYDSIDHHFNFNSYNSLEVPLMLTYTKNRVVFLAGAGFRYNFAISSLQEVEQKYLSEKKYYSTSEPQFETEQKILLSDFAPTFNVSPIVGVGYQFKPGFRLDCRLSQPLLNNANTAGQKEIAKGLYNKAQFQLNMTWKLSSNKPYKRK